MGRTIIVGDVHGCIEEFQSLLTLVSFERGKDRLIQVGDLMDRGPDPAGCVRFAREVGAEVIKGNHEDKHVRWRKHELTRGAKKNPVQSMNELRCAQNMQLSDEEILWLSECPLTIQVNPSLIVVHAGMEPAYAANRQSDVVFRIRYVDDGTRGKLDKFVGFSDGSLTQPANTVFWSLRWRGPESVVYGHATHTLDAPRVDAFDGGSCYGIDTGCVYGGRLTAMVIVDGQAPEFAQVQAREVYYDGWHPQPI